MTPLPQTYSPPHEITPMIIDLIEKIGESLGRITATTPSIVPPPLRRARQIKSVQASLAIEGNTLSLEQITAVLDGQPVLGVPREIQEVRNGFAAYELLENLNPCNQEDLCKTHATLMHGLIDRPRVLRTSNVGIKRGDDLVHIAPPSDQITFLLRDLLNWLETTTSHPLIASSIFHYEFEFIHPFVDGNGRLGRLWQTLILGKWNPIFFMIPIETVICDNQSNYYQALRQGDDTGNATPFIEFLLGAILASCEQLTGEVTGEATGEVKKLITVLTVPMSRKTLQTQLGLKSQANFRERYLQPALKGGYIEMTIPDKPKSSGQQYRLTPKGQEKITD